MRVLHVTPECFPFVKTGGLGDVAAALPRASRRVGVDARVILPGYPAVLEGVRRPRVLGEIADLPGLYGRWRIRLILGEGSDGLPVYAVDAPELFARAGHPYVDPTGRDWPDNALRFGALCHVAARLALDGAGGDWRPAVVQSHDWQAGLVPALLALAPTPDRPASVMTVHNLAFQGLFPAEFVPDLGLPWGIFRPDGIEFHGRLGFLKAGLHFADRLTTVSPTYAREIQTEACGFGLDGLLRHRADRLTGILNGVDTNLWNPAADPALPSPYEAATLERKAVSKAAVERAFALTPDPKAPLFALVSRLTEQKGIDLVLAALPTLVAAGGRLAVLGSGTPGMEAAVADALARYPGRCGVRFGHDEGLSHLVQAGADVLLVPSRFEPCGLTQMYALRYGTLPVVTAVGGLADTVTDTNPSTLADGTATGFVMAAPTREHLETTLARALTFWGAPDAWRSVQRTGMARDVGWAAAAARYADLYRELVAERA